MKLSAEEVQIIENALIEKCNFKDFDDVRLEMVDHIATEIEAEMENNKLLFNAAFVKVMTRWNPMILPKTWSRYEEIPYIVCDFWKKLDWKNRTFALSIAIILSAAFKILESHLNIDFLMYAVMSMGIVSIFYLYIEDLPINSILL